MEESIVSQLTFDENRISENYQQEIEQQELIDQDEQFGIPVDYEEQLEFEDIVLESLLNLDDTTA